MRQLIQNNSRNNLIRWECGKHNDSLFVRLEERRRLRHRPHKSSSRSIPTKPIRLEKRPTLSRRWQRCKNTRRRAPGQKPSQLEEPGVSGTTSSEKLLV